MCHEQQVVFPWWKVICQSSNVYCSDHKHEYNELCSYSFETDTWKKYTKHFQKHNKLQPPALSNHSMFYSGNDTLLLLNGTIFGYQLTYASEKARTWRKIQYESIGDSLVSTKLNAMAMYGNDIYVFGGCEVHHDVPICQMMLYYGIQYRKEVVFAANSDIPAARERHGMVECFGKLYIFGGKNQYQLLNDLHEFDPETKKCKQIDPKGYDIM